MSSISPDSGGWSLGTKRGKHLVAAPSEQEQRPRSTVAISFNPGAKARPYSLRRATDPSGRASWGDDSNGRPRTFATQSAAEEAARRSSAAPVVFEYVGIVPEAGLGDREGELQELRQSSRETFRDLESAGVGGVVVQGGEVVGSVPAPRSSENPYSRARRLERERFEDQRESRSDRLAAIGRLGGLTVGRAEGRDLASYARQAQHALGHLSQGDKEILERGWREGATQRRAMEREESKVNGPGRAS